LLLKLWGRIFTYAVLKSIFALTGAFALAIPAQAGGFYVNGERNDGFVGQDHSGAATELHIGAEGQIGAMSVYAQAGPAYLTPAGAEDSELELSGKMGGAIGITEKLGAYWEAAFMTGDDQNSYGTKLGAKYSF
jgi:hypothetical protein|tara:strand:- start:12 stop:413 length:402 start_codon:yes stop_codon:yes gene_type:complete